MTKQYNVEHVFKELERAFQLKQEIEKHILRLHSLRNATEGIVSTNVVRVLEKELELSKGSRNISMLYKEKKEFINGLKRELDTIMKKLNHSNVPIEDLRNIFDKEVLDKEIDERSAFSGIH